MTAADLRALKGHLTAADLRALIGRKLVKQWELANKVGISQGMLNSMLRGRRKLDQDIADRLVDLLADADE